MSQENVKQLPDKVRAFFKDPKKTKWILILGLIGMACILLSECNIGKKATSTQGQAQATQQEQESTQEYEEKLEEKIKNMVCSIRGVGNAQVMVTLENGVEYVYAQEEKKNMDLTKDYSGSAEKKLQQKDNTEQKIIIVEGEDGNKTALVKTKLEPKVKGVVITCDGGASAKIQQQVTEAVATALDISWDKIFVSQGNSAS